MKRKVLVELLIDKGLLSATTANKIQRLIAKLLKPKAEYAPVKVQVQQHPLNKGRRN
jgi:hypothetical protein